MVVCGDVLSCFATGDKLKSFTGAVISAAFLHCLMRTSVRRYFDAMPEIHAAGR